MASEESGCSLGFSFLFRMQSVAAVVHFQEGVASSASNCPIVGPHKPILTRDNDILRQRYLYGVRWRWRPKQPPFLVPHSLALDLLDEGFHAHLTHSTTNTLSHIHIPIRIRSFSLSLKILPHLKHERHKTYR
jgi:hypothetical protein